MVAISIDGLEGYGNGCGVGAVGLCVGMFQAGVTDPGVQALDAAGGDVGVYAVIDSRDAVVSEGGLSGYVVVEVGVQEAVSPCAAVSCQGGQSAERVLLLAGNFPKAGEVRFGPDCTLVASPCASLGAAPRAVVGGRPSVVDRVHAGFAQGGIARGALEEEMVAMGIEGFVDPAGGDVGGVHPLTLAFFPCPR